MGFGNFCSLGGSAADVFGPAFHLPEHMLSTYMHPPSRRVNHKTRGCFCNFSGCFGGQGTVDYNQVGLILVGIVGNDLGEFFRVFARQGNL